MRLTDEDRAEVRQQWMNATPGMAERIYAAGMAAGRLRGIAEARSATLAAIYAAGRLHALEEAAKACATIKTMASTDAADRHWIAGVAYCIDAIRTLAASGTGAKG